MAQLQDTPDPKYPEGMDEHRIGGAVYGILEYLREHYSATDVTKQEIQLSLGKCMRDVENWEDK